MTIDDWKPSAAAVADGLLPFPAGVCGGGLSKRAAP